MAPHRPPRRRRRRRADPADQVLRWVVGESINPRGTRAVESGVELDESGVEPLAVGRLIRDLLDAVSLMLCEGGEAIAEVALDTGCLLDPPLSRGDLGLGVSDGLAVVATPAPPAGLLQLCLARPQKLFGPMAMPHSLR